MPLFHITWTTVGRLRFDTLGQVERAVGCLDEVVGDRMVSFAVADDHIHALLPSHDVGVTGRAVRLSLNTVHPMQPAYPVLVESRSHLDRVLKYQMFDQHEKHDLLAPPGLYPGTSLPDLVGARVLRNYRPARIPRQSSRWTPEFALARLGAPGLEPLPQERLAELGPALVFELARRTVFRLPHSKGKARALTCQACGVHPATRRVVGLTRRGAYRARQRQLDDELWTALRMRAALELALRP